MEENLKYHLQLRVKIVVVSFILMAFYYVYHTLDIRISKLENKGMVQAYLEPNKPKTEETISHLDNIRMKIIMDSDDISCLAKNIYYEARNQGYIGQIAIAQTTFNRVNEGKWGDTICEVVYSPKQFSWTNKKQKAPYGKAWKRSLYAAKSFQYGLRVNTLNDSTFYHASYVNPKWASNMIKVAHIGKHIFYDKQ
jgi:spore germination cell wall hydrolase CwlJ-like protein